MDRGSIGLAQQGEEGNGMGDGDGRERRDVGMRGGVEASAAGGGVDNVGGSTAYVPRMHAKRIIDRDHGIIEIAPNLEVRIQREVGASSQLNLLQQQQKAAKRKKIEKKKKEERGGDEDGENDGEEDITTFDNEVNDEVESEIVASGGTKTTTTTTTSQRPVAVSDITRNIGITMSGRLRRERHKKMEMIVPSRLVMNEEDSQSQTRAISAPRNTDFDEEARREEQDSDEEGKEKQHVPCAIPSATTTTLSDSNPPPPNLYTTYTYTLIFRISKEALQEKQTTAAKKRKNIYAALVQAVSPEKPHDLLHGEDGKPFIRVQNTSDTNIIPLKLEELQDDEEGRSYYSFTSTFTLQKSEETRLFRVQLHVFDSSSEAKIERFVESATKGDGSKASILSILSVDLNLSIKKKRKAHTRKRKRSGEEQDADEIRKRLSEIITIKDYKKLLKKLTNVRDNLSLEERYEAEELTIDRLKLEHLDIGDLRYLAKMSQYSSENRLDHHFGMDLPFSIRQDGFEELETFFDECEEAESKRRQLNSGQTNDRA